jgi:DNA-binding winged helix-turn-helix (wHTH) protein/tetratricopeptide (TPR) repeat protein
MSDKTSHIYEFENFRLDTRNPSLWRGGELVPISPKALEILILLVQKKGEIVSREDLLETVWKGSFVEEGNINYTVSLLRKTLGNKDLVQTIPRRGYRFQADVKQISENGVLPVIESVPVPASRRNRSRPLFFTILISGVVLVAALLAVSRLGSRSAGSPPSEPNAGSPAAESLKAYKRGKMILDDRDVEGRAQKALDEFQQAVTLDPTSALAFTGLAEGLASKAASMPNDRSREFYAKANAALDRAFSLNANLFEGFLVRGWLRRNGDWNWSGAEEDFRRALELNPNSALAHYRYAQLLANIGRYPEALAEIDRASELDPLSETIISGRFPILESAREYDKGLKLAEEYLQSNSENQFARRAVGTFQYHRGDYARVIETGEIALAKAGKNRPFAWLSLLGAAYLRTGQKEKADAMLRELEIQSHTDKKALYSLAMNYAELGRVEEAITALETCFETREQRMMWVSVEPRFANLKNEPRFRQLLGKMRLN